MKEIFGEETEDDYRTFLDDKNFDNGNKYGHQFFRALPAQKVISLGIQLLPKMTYAAILKI